ncbi:MAG: hypothetical protein RIQ50_98 [Bacteroidota bacterium]|jgi:2-dehydro-3-deoxy-D-arabinonate dehydratase
MKLYNFETHCILETPQGAYAIPSTWDALVNRTGLYHYLEGLLPELKTVAPIDAQQPLLPPVQSQEIWAAGVTYYRSKEAREKESADSGGGSFYDRVYVAERPELFFKSFPERVAGHQGSVHIRRDSTWDVPEPELTLFISSAGTVEGFTVGNDMSSRSIEGENPLYLAQAKVYDRSAALGPCLAVFPNEIPIDSRISLTIYRNDAQVFSGNTTIASIKRTWKELAEFLFRETSFPNGVMLMTGTGVVPPDEFTLKPGDKVCITIDHIGLLVNTVKYRS